MDIISALRERLSEPDLLYRFRVPRSLGYFPDLQLLLMEALPGKPFFKPLLKAWIENNNRQAAGNENPSHDEDATLEKAIQTCALIAATLHGSNIQLGARTTLEIQVAKLQAEADVLYEVFPELGAQVKSWINQTVEFAQAYPAMPLCFSHGDFTYTQLIFDGKEGGLVDFDTMCQAEPAQDLGHYLAYQRLNIIKDQDPNSPFPPEAIEHLCAIFLDTYIDVSKGWIADEALLRGRVAIYELISLIRLTLHSWEKMKGSRLKQTMSVARGEDRMSETDQSIAQKQDALIWEGLQTFRDLPDWMMAARDPDRICAAFSEAIPEFRSGQLILHECDSSNIRYKGENWQGFYELTVSKPGESSTSEIHLQGVLTAPGVNSSRPLLVENALGSKDWHAVIPALNLELWTKEPEVCVVRSGNAHRPGAVSPVSDEPHSGCVSRLSRPADPGLPSQDRPL